MTDNGTVSHVAQSRWSGRRRDSGLPLISAGVLVLVICVAPITATRAALSEEADSNDQGAEQLLLRAGNALGGAERLRAIDRLQITTIERDSRRPEAARGRVYKLWLPDRFQSRVGGVVTHTLNGGRLTFDQDVPLDVRRAAEQAVPAMFRRVALAFLLRAPGLSAPRLQGEETIAGIKGVALEATAPDGRSLKVLFEPESAQPLAIVYPAFVAGSTERLPDQVWRLEDYRTVSGLRFPFRLTTVLAPDWELTTDVSDIKVNPPFTPADFPK